MVRKFLIILLLPTILYTAVALFITYPLVTQLSTHVIGSEFTDSYEFVRWGWWGKYALQQGVSPFYQSLFGYPDGFFSTVQWSQPLVYWPIAFLNFFLSPVAAFNAWILIELALNGLTAYWLCRTVIGKQESWLAVSGALFGGLIFMDLQTVQGHLTAGHVNILGVYALPLLAMALYRVIQGERTRRTLAVGMIALLVLLLSNYTAPVYLIFPLYLFLLLYIVVGALARRQPLPWSMLRAAAAILIGGITLALPFYLPMALEAVSPNRPSFYTSGEVLHYSTDLLAFATMSFATPWTRFIENPVTGWIIGVDGVEGAAYLGIVAVLLAAIAFFAFRRDDARRVSLWLVIALGSMILSLGPALKWAGFAVIYSAADFSGTIAMPWALFQNLPVFNLARTPARINFVTGLCLAVLAALGLFALLRRIKFPVLQAAVTIILAIVTVAEHQEHFPFPTIPAQLPKAFYDLAGRSDIRAVLDVPLSSLTGTKEALFEQTAHLKPLIAGYVARATPVSADKLTLLSAIAMGDAHRIQDNQPLDADTARSVLKANGVDILVYHWRFVDKVPVLRRATSAFNQPLYQDDQTAIFEVPAPEKAVEASATAYESMGWSASDKAPWFGDNSALLLYTSRPEDRHVSLNLTPLLTERQVRLTVDGHYQGLWLLTPPAQQVDFWLRLAPGFHRLQFTFPDGCTPVPVVPECLVQPNASRKDCQLQDKPVKADQEVCVSAGIAALSVTDSASMSYREHPVQLAEGMALQGFRLPDSIGPNQKLVIETDWQTAQPLHADYHYFIHITAPDGNLAGQFDSIPDNGHFPTTTWANHQQWSELDTIDSPAKVGTYSVYVGWYRYPDLARLAVQGGGPHAADGLVYLGDFEAK